MEFPPELAESLFHRTRHEVLGRRLAPLSLKHLAALFASESPFVTDTAREADLGDLVVAVGICACRDDGELDAFMTGDDRERERAVAQLAGAQYGATQAEQMARWNEYWADYFSPVRILPGGRSRKLQMPWVLNLACRLMRYGHFSERQAWWTTPGAAFHYQLCWKEIAGDDFEVLTPKSRAEWKRLGWTDAQLDGLEDAEPAEDEIPDPAEVGRGIFESRGERRGDEDG